MKLKEFELKEGNYFVAIEYYRLLMNQTFLILITEKYLVGILANGLISVEGGKDILTREVTKKMAVKGDLQNPFSYVKEKYIIRIENEDLFENGFLTADKANFRIDKADIANVEYDSKKKWGMGYYPHDGKVYVKTKDGKKREFIILGNQSGENIRNWIVD